MLRLSSVSKASKEVGITQSGLSNGLNKMRIQFDDQLLVRCGQIMELTIIGEKLSRKLSSVFVGIDEIIADKIDFDPLRDSFEFNIMVSDYAGLTIVPAVVSYFQKNYPKVKIHAHRSTYDDIRDPLQSLKYDFAINAGPKSQLRIGLFTKNLFQEEYAVGVCKRHPRIKEKLSLSRYLQEKHIFVDPPGLNAVTVDQQLMKLNKQRDIVQILPSVSVGCQILKNSDMLLTLPKNSLEIVSQGMDIKIMPTPMKVPRFDVSLIWHEKTHSHPAYKWFRKEIASMNFCS